MDPEENKLVEQLNEDFEYAVLPVNILLITEILVGFFGNNLFICFCWNYFRVSSSRDFDLCLSITYLLSTLTTMPGEVLTQIKWYAFPGSQICKIKSFFKIFTLSIEMFCFLTIAVHRYRIICRPFAWQMKPRIARIICIAIYIFSALFSTPVYILLGTKSVPKLYKNTSITVTICGIDEYFVRTQRPFHYVLSIYVVYGISFTSMIVLNFLFVRKIHVSRLHHLKRVAASMEQMKAMKLIPQTSMKLISLTSTSSNGKLKISSVESPERYKESSISNSMNTVTKEDGISSNNVSQAKIDEMHMRRKKLNNEQNELKKQKEYENLRKGLKKEIIGLRIVPMVTFIVTTVCYLSFAGIIANNDNVLEELSDDKRTVYFFFMQLYFINHVVTPFSALYQKNVREKVKQILLCATRC